MFEKQCLVVGFLFDKLCLSFRMTRDLIFIMNYQYIPGQVSVNTLDTHLPESVLKHESCDLKELNELNELVDVLIDKKC